MPELMVFLSAGFVATLLLTLLFIFLLRRRNSSHAVKTLQQNLGKVEKYWASSKAEILPGTEADFFRDQAISLRSALVIGGLLMFLSWLGFILLLLVMLSVRYLAVSKFEKSVFASRLAKDSELSKALVEETLRELSPSAPLP